MLASFFWHVDAFSSFAALRTFFTSILIFFGQASNLFFCGESYLHLGLMNKISLIKSYIHTLYTTLLHCYLFCTVSNINNIQVQIFLPILFFFHPTILIIFPSVMQHSAQQNLLSLMILLGSNLFINFLLLLQKWLSLTPFSYQSFQVLSILIKNQGLHLIIVFFSFYFWELQSINHHFHSRNFSSFYLVYFIPCWLTIQHSLQFIVIIGYLQLALLMAKYVNLRSNLINLINFLGFLHFLEYLPSKPTLSKVEDQSLSFKIVLFFHIMYVQELQAKYQPLIVRRDRQFYEQIIQQIISTFYLAISVVFRKEIYQSLPLFQDLSIHLKQTGLQAILNQIQVGVTQFQQQRRQHQVQQQVFRAQYFDC